MASHTEIRVGDTNWVVRVDGQDVKVKVLEKTKKSSGRGYDFRCKRVGADNRVFGRNLVRGSGSFRRPGVPPKTTGFAKGGKKKPPARKRAAPAPAPKPRAATQAPRAPRTPVVQRNPPASAFFSQVQEPGMPRSSPPPGSPRNGRSSTSRLGSLRGRGRTPASSASAPARPTATQAASQTRREIEKLLKQADLSPLFKDLMKELLKGDGTDFSASQIFGRVVANHRMSSFGMPFGSF